MGQITKIMIMVVLVSLIFLGFGSSLISLSDTYGTPIDKDIRVINVTARVYNQTNALRDQLSDSSVSASDPVNSFIVITNSGLQAVGLLISIPDIMISLLTSYFDFIPGFPTEIISAFILIVLIVIVFLGLLPLILRSAKP